MKPSSTRCKARRSSWRATWRSGTRMDPSSFRELQLHAQVSDLAEAQPSELRHSCRDLFKYVFDHVDAVLPGQREDQVAQNLPVVASLSRRIDRAVEALEAAFDVDHRAALFGKAAAWQKDGRELGGGVRQHAHRDQRVELQ